MFSLRHFVVRKVTTGANEAMSEVAAGAKELQNEPSQEEDGNEDSVKDKKDHRRAINVETEGDLRDSKEENATSEPMMQHRVKCNPLPKLFGITPAHESAEERLEDHSDIQSRSDDLFQVSSRRRPKE